MSHGPWFKCQPYDVCTTSRLWGNGDGYNQLDIVTTEETNLATEEATDETSLAAKETTERFGGTKPVVNETTEWSGRTTLAA